MNVRTLQGQLEPDSANADLALWSLSASISIRMMQGERFHVRTIQSQGDAC